MKYRFLFLVFIFAGINSGAQNIVTLSQDICDSINSVYTGKGNKKITYQYNIQYSVLKKHSDQFAEDTTKETNKFLYSLVQQLTRNCPVYELEQSFLLGETSVLDLEGLFTGAQIDTLQVEAAKLRENKDFGLLIVSVDDLYPYNSIKEFAIGQGYVWSIGSGLSKGGIVVAFSKKLKRVRISTSSLSKQYLPNEDSQKMIDKVLLPKFTRGKYYDAMIELIKKLDEEL